MIKIITILLFCVGCVTKSSYVKIQNELSKEQNDCNQKLSQLQSEFDKSSSDYSFQINKLEEDLKLKNERLSKFNQVDVKGNLLENHWHGKIDKSIKGDEEWMK